MAATIPGFVQNANTDEYRGKDTNLGMVVYDHQIKNPRTGAAPVVADVDRLVVAVLPVGGSTQVFTIVAQPDVCRNATMTIVDANSSITSLNAVVYGTDYWGNVISERLDYAVGGSKSVVGTMGFQTVTRITAVTTGTIGGADTVSFGIGSGLGLPVRIGVVGDVWYKRETANQDTTGVITINAGGSATWVPATVPDNTKTYFCTIKSTYGMP